MCPDRDLLVSKLNAPTWTEWKNLTWNISITIFENNNSTIDIVCFYIIIWALFNSIFNLYFANNTIFSNKTDLFPNANSKKGKNS